MSSTTRTNRTRTHTSPAVRTGLALLCYSLFCSLAPGWTTGVNTAHADAILTSSGAARFPTTLDIRVDLRAQVEVTTMVLSFEPITEAGDYVLTVPSPDLAYVIGVDIDRGGGFQPAPMVGEAPPPALGGSDEANDPEVAAWLGTTPLKADFSDLETGPLTVRVRFQRLLRRYHAEVEFDAGIKRSPLRPLGAPDAAVSLLVQLKTSRSLTRLDVSAPGVIVEQLPTGATIQAAGALDSDMLVHIAYAEILAGIDVRFFTHRTASADPLGGEEGYFLLLVDADDAGEASAMARTLSMVIDQSGSMEGAKIIQATEAARAMLEHLGPNDSFNIIRFDSDVESFATAPVPANSTNISLARDFIKDIRAEGSTNLDGAVRTGLLGIGAGESQRFDSMILLSDGIATQGETDPVRIHDNALANNLARARLFTVSVGNDADGPLMEALARSNRGQHFDLNDAQATVDMVRLVRQLFEDIRVVRLTDMELSFTNIGLRDVLPEEMRDLFSGGQAVLVGRYRTPASGVLRITGNDNGTAFSRDVAVNAPVFQPDNEFIKYVWATEQVGTLLADMSRGGNIEVLEDRIRAIGLAYRIQTPYSSFTSGQPADAGGGTPSSGGSSGGGSGGCGGCSSGGGGGSGWGGAGAVDPLEIGIALLLILVAVMRRRMRDFSQPAGA
jgi:uncharacterized membrane protein YgcG